MKFLPRFWIFFSDENQFGGGISFWHRFIDFFSLKKLHFHKKITHFGSKSLSLFLQKTEFWAKIELSFFGKTEFFIWLKKTWINWGKLCGTASQLKSILLFFIQYLLEIWICWKFYFKTKLWSKIHKNQDIFDPETVLESFPQILFENYEKKSFICASFGVMIRKMWNFFFTNFWQKIWSFRKSDWSTSEHFDQQSRNLYDNKVKITARLFYSQKWRTCSSNGNLERYNPCMDDAIFIQCLTHPG